MVSGTDAVAPRSQNWPHLFRQFTRIAGGFWGGTNWQARGQLGVLVALTAAQVTVQVALNLWTEQLFNAFGTRSMGGFVVLASVFALILAANLLITTSHLWLRRRLQIRWRQWLAHRLAGEWMASGRHYRMAYMPGDHDNPDGRISEDVRIATEAAIDLGHSLLYCLMLLASFIHILWTLSGDPPFTLGDVEFHVPGHLVWIAVIYSAIGVAIALLLGPRLVTTAEARQTYEANFRFGLVHARENAAAIALVLGEGSERRRFGELLKDAVEAWNRQTWALFRFTIFSSSWSVLSPVFPVLIAAPRYISGAITLGVLMQIAQAFQQATSALSWPIDNLSHAADWRASVERILGLQAGIDGAKRADWCDQCDRIGVSGAPNSVLTFHDVTIVNPAGETAVDGLNLKIARGEQLWLYGDPPASSALIKALAGLWTSGRGRIELPIDGPLYFMPQRPYLPLATLAEVVSYPAVVGDDQDPAIRACLDRVGLDHLGDRLRAAETWEETLSPGEQQRIGFARLLFHHPRWVVLEAPADALGAASQREMMELLRTEFANATLIVAGDSAPPGIDWKRIPLPTMAYDAPV